MGRLSQQDIDTTLTRARAGVIYREMRMRRQWFVGGAMLTDEEVKDQTWTEACRRAKCKA